MRRDVVTQIIVEYPSGCENFATRLEAERFINANLEEEEPVAVWVEEVNGKKKYDLHFAEEKRRNPHCGLRLKARHKEKRGSPAFSLDVNLSFSIPDSSFGQISEANR